MQPIIAAESIPFCCSQPHPMLFCRFWQCFLQRAPLFSLQDEKGWLLWQLVIYSHPHFRFRVFTGRTFSYLMFRARRPPWRDANHASCLFARRSHASLQCLLFESSKKRKMKKKKKKSNITFEVKTVRPQLDGLESPS